MGRSRHGGGSTWGGSGFTNGQHPITDGRWPANVCHDGSDEVLAGFPDNVSTLSRIKHGDGESTPNGIYGAFKARDRIAGFEDQGSVARFFFSAKAGAGDRWGSRHPTVKPIELMKWLVALVTPLDGLVLDPFAGSGTTGAAALHASRDALLIEREANYIADIRERIAFYEGDGRHSVEAKYRTRTVEHGPLFDQEFSTPTRGGEY